MTDDLRAARHRALDPLLPSLLDPSGPSVPLVAELSDGGRVFWPRQGYRPLWTRWEARPAWALR